MANKHIYFAKEKECNIPNESLGTLLLQTLKKRNSDEAILIDVTSKCELTYGQLIENSIIFAEVLKKLEVEANDVISTIYENDISSMYFLVGCLLNGVIFNPINPSYFPDELRHMLSLSRPKLVITTHNSLTNLLKILPELDFIKNVITIGKVPQPPEHQLQSIEDLMKSIKVDVDAFVPLTNFDAAQQGAVIFSSSGTSGVPKGVLLSHTNLRQLTENLIHKDYFNLRSGSVLQVVPNFHIMGLCLQLPAMMTEMKIVMLKEFEVDPFVNSIKKYRVTNLMAVPALLRFLVKSPSVQKHNMFSLLDILVGAAPVSKELKAAIKDKFPNAKVREIYGATELTALVVSHPMILSKYKGAGVLQPGVMAKVCDVETGENLPPLKKGELCFKTLQVMLGYIRNEITTKESIDQDGFYHTGDLGYFDEDGNIFIVDRIKELIKYKGFQVAPAELEFLIHKHPDVKECGVVGIPDERAGEVPLAVVVKYPNVNLTEQDILNYVAERISIQKRLYGGVKFIDALPKNSTGKVMRRKLKEMFVNNAL